MNKQDLAISIQTMEAQRKGGGFSFDVMPLAAETMQKLQHLFNLLKDGETLVIHRKEDAGEAKPSESKATK